MDSFDFIKIITRISLCIITITTLDACSDKEWQTADGAAWSTTYHIKYLGKPQLKDSILEIISNVNNSLSPFNSASVVSKINNNENLKVDSLFVNVFEVSQYINSLSEGAFDPTVAPAINLWGFGYKNDTLPSVEALDSIRSLVGIDDCRIVDGIIQKKSPHTEFNFSAIAKGYGCDLIANMLRRNGVSDFMVEIGGEIVLSGKNPEGNDWTILVVTPPQGVGERDKIYLSLSDCAIATSGNYRNFKDTPDGRIGHTIDPSTCLPVSTTVFSATVIAPTDILADALATAAMVMSPEKATEIAKKIPEVELMLIVQKSPDNYELIMTEGIKNFIR